MTETKSTKPGFSAEERAAMRQRAKELKAAATREDGARQLREAVEKLSGLDREMADKVVALIEATASDLDQKTYYGFPAWAKDGKTLFFFKPASKFKQRYATFAFEDSAPIDDGVVFATSFAIMGMTPADEKMLVALVKKAIG